MRFLTCQIQPDSPPCLAVWLESGWFQLKGCRDFRDWLRLTPLEREQALGEAQPITPLLYLPPVLQPPSVRDFYAFETHVRNAHRRRGREVPAEWYQMPAFYFSNPASLMGHEQPVRKPPDTEQLDYELELAVIIGREGGDWSLAEAESAIAGFTIMNDWSARDIQRVEMRIGLGPAKAKDFATSLGPWVVTPDELEPWRQSDPAHGSRWQLPMRAWVNGVLMSEGNASEMYWSFAQLIAHAARNTRLQIGDVIGSGTVGTGCLLERPEGTHRWLQPGDIVELEIEGIGRLRNPVI
jgi:fumarylacetoacetate (FAA) hydrolase